MKVNMYKLIKLLLPTFLRGNMISELVRAMLLQLEYAFNRFNTNVPDWLYKANTNASVQCLEHHIKRELDVDAVITELDGLPIDFLVTITGFVDENQLRVLIDTYKLAGKSYVFKVGSVAYTAEFTNYVCEDIREGWTAEFSDYVCEDDRICNITANTNVSGGNYQVTISADRPIQSAINVVGHVFVYTDSTLSSGGYARFNAIIGSGNTTVITNASSSFAEATFFITVIESISPESDASLNYNFLSRE